MKNLIANYKKLDKQRQITWLVFGLVAIVYYFTLMFTDIWITYEHSLSLLDCIRSGNLLGFYSYTVDHTYGNLPATYFIPIYFLFGLWNLPCWIVTRFFGVSTTTVGCLLWAKTMLVLFFLLSVREFLIIYRKLQIENEERTLFTLCSSMFVALPILALAQYDIIELFFILWGLRVFLEEEKLSFKVLLIFSVGISFKAYAVFVFMILLLHVEKNPFVIIRDLIIGAAFSILILMPFIRGFFAASSSCNSNFIEQWLSLRIDMGWDAEISVFFLLIFLTGVVAYMLKSENILDAISTVIYLSLIVWIVFFSTTFTSSHWVILMAPFLIFVLAGNDKYYQLNSVVEIVLEVAFVLAQAYTRPQLFFNEHSFEHLLMKGLPRTNNIISSYARAIEFTIIGRGEAVFFALFVACAIAILVINNVYGKGSFFTTEKEKMESVDIRSRWIRIGLLILYYIVTLWNAYLI